MILDDMPLNPPQTEAVLATEGPVLILAGAGSGKTRTLTARVAYLLEQGVRPWNILAITFTNKAAEEMKNRVSASSPEGDKVWVATFHSTCLRILRSSADRLGYGKDFSVYDTDDSRVVMRHLLKELDFDPKQYREREMQRVISALKNKMISVEENEKAAGQFRDKRIARIYGEYQKRLMAANAMDFDDLLLNAVKLFEENPDVLEYWRSRFRYVLVDEYQDTNPAQFRFVELLAKEHRNLCVVGDDDQSIYRFRGAEIRNILEFESVFPETKVIRLEQNYRSTKNILAAANGVIAHNKSRKVKTLWTAQEEGEKPIFREYEEAREEARGIVRDIIKEKDRFPYGDCAVLYRTNAQSRLLEETLVAMGVPYRLIGGVNFYERREIKDCLCYLRLIANPRDDVSLRRIINVPRRGIGDSTVEKLASFAAEQELSMLEAIDACGQAPELARSAGKLKPFMDLIIGLRMEALSVSVEALIERTLRESGYLESLQAEDPIEAEARRENLNELINKAADFGGEVGLDALSQFLSETSLVSDIDELPDNEGKVVLMTLHSAKGLEFPKVYMAGMEQQLFPGDKALYSGDSTDLEEERRLCYVGITRAMKKLVLTAAARRMVNGQYTTHLVSQFIDEIPAENVKRERSGIMMSRGQYESRREQEDYYSGSGRFGRRRDEDFGSGSFGRWGRSEDRSPFPDYENDFGDAPQSFGRKTENASDRGSTASAKAAAGLTEFFEKAAAKASDKETLTQFAPGDRVVNRRFGAGTVVKVEQGKKDLLVTVDFDKYGRKVMMAEYAGFTRE